MAQAPVKLHDIKVDKKILQFLHTIRRNPDIVHIVHNNMVYGLTKGQASPTSQRGFVSKVQVDGAKNEPFNPLSVALSLKAGFVSRVNIGNYSHAKEVLKATFLHKGYALVDIFQPCVVFNQVNTYQWFKKHTYLLEEDYDGSNFEERSKKPMRVCRCRWEFCIREEKNFPPLTCM